MAAEGWGEKEVLTERVSDSKKTRRGVGVRVGVGVGVGLWVG